MSKVIAVCPSCKQDNGFSKTLVSDHYCCENCKIIFHYAEMDYKIEGENDITTKGILVCMNGEITRDGKFPGFPFTKGDSIGV
jgi:transposase-like protein